MSDRARTYIDQVFERMVTDLKIDEAEAAGFFRPNRNEDFCDHSFLRPAQCAHCQGHTLDEEGEAMVQVNLR